MIRVASQFTFCSPQQILSRTVVEQNEHNVITRLFSLDESAVESAQTLFFDGILSAEIISLKENILQEELTKIIENYQYIDFSTENKLEIILPTNKSLLIDFGTILNNEINAKIASHAFALQHFSIFEIIAACTYFPSIVLGLPASLTPTRCSQLLLWENVDLINKKVTKHTKIRKIN
jgi:hypothetical protein